MKNKLHIAAVILFICICVLSPHRERLFAGNFFDETTLITLDTLHFIKPPADFRNYFFLQSIDDTTVILIGDFVRAVKVITLIIDNNSDNTVDRVIEYYPESNEYRKKKNFTSEKYTTNIEALKKEIIEGTIYKNSYSYDMKSLAFLKYLLNEGSSIYNTEAGWVAIKYDEEKAKSTMSKFFFRLKDERYDLVFKTNYYRLYKTIIHPPISHSVYCRNSKDPVIAEYVKNLLKLLPN
ncbi:MAG: hypothetical protein JW864_04435 [Spirochaetes bacterium]|nr:hypothetical protein [Spirochaetota bacterium]